jgi:hypothetical protein
MPKMPKIVESLRSVLFKSEDILSSLTWSNGPGFRI